MADPLAEVVTLLQPSAKFSKYVLGAGAWEIRRSDMGQPFYCVILEGGCRLAVDSHEPVMLQAGDFALLPAASDVALCSVPEPPPGVPGMVPIAVEEGVFRVGAQKGPTNLRMVAGHCSFGSADAALLVSLLPQLIHVRGEPRLSTLVDQVRDESRGQRPAREVVLARLLEVLLIEALRSSAATVAKPGLLRGLADARLAAALRAVHAQPQRAWTVSELAKEAALSRSAFFDRFSRALGVAPMEYLLAWRMALAKDLLRRNAGGVSEIAERVGYSSASTFSVAFSRHVGAPPTHYAREHANGTR